MFTPSRYVSTIVNTVGVADIVYTEGDLEKNAKLWYEQIDAKVLSTFWGDDEPAKKAHAFMYKVQKVEYHQKPTEKDEKLENDCRETKWKELVAILEALEAKHGWKGGVDGTTSYTRDEDPGHKSNVLG